MIDFDLYQQKAMSLRLPSANEAYALTGFVAEVGEFFNLVAKGIRDGVENSEEHHNKKKKELGDILWFVAAIADDHGFTLSELAEGNLTKLFSRQAAGTLQGSGDER